MQRFQALGLALCCLLFTACQPIQRPAPTPAPMGELPLLNQLVESVEPVAQAGELFNIPFDATPDPAGDTIYFTADGPQGPGVFAVTADGTITPLATGAPLVNPLGIAISHDGQTLYVADPGATQGDGELFTLPITGGEPMPLAGATGATPRNLEIVREEGMDAVYFTGNNPADGTPAVLRLTTDGLGHTVVAQGAPLVDPQGVAVTAEGVVYVADGQAGGDGLAAVFKIADGQIESITSGFRTGVLAGATLTQDEGALLVSALHSERDSAQVLVIVLADGSQGLINAVIEANDGSGGVHRAHASDVLAWADLSNGGSVYKIKPPRGS
jgi:DNA-binding beta-propeller fold protein YncE